MQRPDIQTQEEMPGLNWNMAQNTTQPGRYRPDIDGLRAVAVLLVVAFHMHLTLPPRFGLWLGHVLHRPSGLVSLFPRGGFVGVDIFFVISGYLIGGILFREAAAGRISLLRFYERRVRRIAPALLAVLTFTYLAVFPAYLPVQMHDFAWSELAATLSWSNVFFWKTSGYFDTPSLSKPLLHTWSLAVEEQFYIVFPLVLIGTRRFRPKLLNSVLIFLTLLSFAASVYELRVDASAAFYLPFTRAWELLAGALLARGLTAAPKTVKGRNAAAIAGMAMLLYAAFRYTNETPFPGASALLPCVGAVLIISAGVTGTSIVGRILALRPVVFVGLISYSLYLWHWPLLLASQFEYVHGFRLASWPLFLLMLGIAALSWRYIEQPFRRDRRVLSRKLVFTSAGIYAAMLTVVSIATITSQGFLNRLPPSLLSLNRTLEPGGEPAHWGDGCFVTLGSPTLQESCLAISKQKPNLLLFGDSHAAHLWFGLTSVYGNVRFEQATASNCKPLLTSYSSPDAFCRELVRNVYERFLPEHPIDGVILSAIWNEHEARALEEAVSRLRAYRLRVYVVGPITRYDQPLAALLYRSVRTGDASFVDRHLALTRQEYRDLDDTLAAASMEGGASRYISLRQTLCPGSLCIHYASPGIPLQSDAMHLTDEGSLLVARKIREHGVLP